MILSEVLSTGSIEDLCNIFALPLFRLARCVHTMRICMTEVNQLEPRDGLITENFILIRRSNQVECVRAIKVVSMSHASTNSFICLSDHVWFVKICQRRQPWQHHSQCFDRSLAYCFWSHSAFATAPQLLYNSTALFRYFTHLPFGSPLRKSLARRSFERASNSLHR